MKKKLSKFSNLQKCATPDLRYYNQTFMDEVVQQYSSANPKRGDWFSGKYERTSQGNQGYIYAIYCPVDSVGNAVGKLCCAPKPPFNTNDTVV